jgi:hypothetical protein
MKKILIIWILVLSTNYCFSQITGKCIDISGKPISYVNIGIQNTTIGTVTDFEGSFVIDDKLLSENNTIIISHVGFETKSIITSKKTEIKIVMKESYYELDEVKIIPSKYKFIKEKRIGNNTLTEHVVVGFSSHNFGSEVGKFFKMEKGKKYKVEKIHFNIAELGYKKGTFRINFYNALDADNISLERINNKDIIMEISKKGDVDINLTNENLVFDNSFLVAIECINYTKKTSTLPKENNVIYFSSNVFCGPIYQRANKVTKWVANKQQYNSCLGMQLYVKL